MWKYFFPTVPYTLFTWKGLCHEIEFKHFDQLTMLLIKVKFFSLFSNMCKTYGKICMWIRINMEIRIRISIKTMIHNTAKNIN